MEVIQKYIPEVEIIPERIEAKYNRLVIFDAGNHLHRVTEVTRGVRYAIAINLWQSELTAVKEGSITIE